MNKVSNVNITLLTPKVLANLHYIYRHYNDLKIKASSLPPEEELPQTASVRRSRTLSRVQSAEFKSPQKIEKDRVHACTGCGGKQREWSKFCVNCGVAQPPPTSASQATLQIPGSAEKRRSSTSF
jgi:hypothetical protein